MLRLNHIRNQLPGSERPVPLLDFCLERFSCEDIQALKLPDESSERRGVVNSESYKVSSAIESLNIFPNPNSGKFEVLYKSNNLREGTLKLMGISGNTVLNGIIIQANQEFQLNLEGIPKGIYILQLEAQDQFFTRKIIVQ